MPCTEHLSLYVPGIHVKEAARHSFSDLALNDSYETNKYLLLFSINFCVKEKHILHFERFTYVV